MAALNTAQKAPLIVHTATGQYVPANGQTLTFAPEGIAAVEGAVEVPDVGTCWYIAGIAPGTTTLTVSGGGSSATLEIEVSVAPLSVELGSSVPR